MMYKPQTMKKDHILAIFHSSFRETQILKVLNSVLEICASFEIGPNTVMLCIRP